MQNSIWDSPLNQSLENLILDKLYPVGSIYLETTNTNPASKLGGTWVEYGSSDAYLRLGGKGSGGSNSIKLVANQIPSLSGTSEGAALAWHSLCKNGNSADKNVSATETLLTDAYGGTGYRFWQANYNSTHSHTFSIRNTNQQSVSITPKYVAVYAWKRTA